MKKFNYKSLLAVVGLLLILFLAKAVYLLIAKPVITVDYVAQYNQQSRPDPYDPADNAALDYQKAYDAFVEMPDELRHLKKWADVNDLEKVSLEKWLASNVKAFEYFRQAAAKPYCWLERISSNIPPVMGDILYPEIPTHRNLVDALIWRAGMNASENQVQRAFDDILICYRSAGHQCRANLLLIDQYLGLNIRNKAIENGFILINTYPIESNVLQYFQGALDVLLKDDTYVPGLQGERLSALDAVQRTFLDNGKGTGRLAWSNGWPVSPLLTDKSTFQVEYENMKERLYTCLIGPSRNEMAAKIEEIVSLTDRVMTRTPWQIQQESIDYFEQIKRINNSHILFAILDLDSSEIYRQYYRRKTQTDALITVLAVLRYKNDTGQFPDSLSSLVAAGYLRSVPKDPYSGNALIYHLTDNGFKLYSVGEDFTDNGGCIDTSRVSMKELSLHIHSPDIVYWPVELIEGNPPDFGTGMPMVGF